MCSKLFPLSLRHEEFPVKGWNWENIWKSWIHFFQDNSENAQANWTSPADPELDSDSLEFFPLKKGSSDAEIICD